MIGSEVLSKDFHVAYDKLQQEIKAVGKDGKNPHFGNAYTTLGSVLDYVKPIISNNGFTIMQVQGRNDGERVLFTRLTHIETCEFIMAESPLPVKDSSDPQKYGGSLTYARRYAIKTLCMMSETDDDGTRAAEPNEFQNMEARIKKIGSSNAPVTEKLNQCGKAEDAIANANNLTPNEKDGLLKLVDYHRGRIMEKTLKMEKLNG